MRIEIYDDGIGSVELVDHMGSDLSIVNAARVSFGKHKTELDEQDINLIRYLIKNSHTSPFEHCQLTFRFKVPMFVRSQHHRHRTWAYNEISRRYTDENIEFYLPKTFRSQHASNKQASKDDEINPMVISHGGSCLWRANVAIKELCQHSEEFYDELLEQGIAKEQARMVLPQNLYTEYYGSVNLHNLFKFVTLRSHPHAQWEIRKVSDACLKIAETLYPHAVEAYKTVGSSEARKRIARKEGYLQALKDIQERLESITILQDESDFSHSKQIFKDLIGDDLIELTERKENEE